MVQPVTVVETPRYLLAAAKLFEDDDRAALLNYLACNPTAGDLIQGTGGVRKLRWGVEGRGKRGGARVIYFYHNADLPLFLLTAYAKNVRSDLSAAERKELKQFVERQRKKDR